MIYSFILFLKYIYLEPLNINFQNALWKLNKAIDDDIMHKLLMRQVDSSKIKNDDDI